MRIILDVIVLIIAGEIVKILVSGDAEVDAQIPVTMVAILVATHLVKVIVVAAATVVVKQHVNIAA